MGGEGPGAVRFDRQTAGLPVESGVTYMVCVWQVTHITFTFLYLWKGVGGGEDLQISPPNSGCVSPIPAMTQFRYLCAK